MFKKICTFVCCAIICIAFTALNNRPIFFEKQSRIEAYLSNSSSGEIVTINKNQHIFVGSIKGESFRVEKNDFNIDEFLTELDGRVIFVEEIPEGTSYYGYSNKIKYKKMFNGQRINFHIFVGENNVTVGAPIIYGSF